jgi:uncharacterized protein HemY
VSLSARVAMTVFFFLLGVLVGLWVGCKTEREAIASAIRSGRLSLVQRVESVAREIEKM